MSSVEYIGDDIVKTILEWDSLILTIEKALADVSRKDESVIQPPRLLMPIPDKEGVLLSMPGYSKNQKSLGCKLVTAFPNNKKLGLPSIYATILLLDPDTGKTKVVLEGKQITGWRTAAASAVATKYMHKGPKNILSILGSGTQAETHALALNHVFNFKEIRIWNRTKENAERLSSLLPFPSRVYETADECTKDADIICTTTFANEAILKNIWLKPGCHINAVGAGINHYSELEEEIYRSAFIAVEHIESASKELKGLLEKGISINCEVGDLIINNCSVTSALKCTVFQSMGLAIEDVTTANLVYDLYHKKQ